MKLVATIGRLIGTLFCGRKKPLAVVYSKPSCHLCDDAVATLIEQGFQVKKIDITNQSDLEKLYGLEIPVVEIDGKVRFRGRVDTVLLRRIVDNARRV